MVPLLFLQGMIIGFSMAVPVGPIAIICIRHSLLRGTIYGLAAGLGAALADFCYACMAGFGTTILCDFLFHYQPACHIIGALFLCYLGMKTLQTKPRERSEEQMSPLSYKRIFLVTFLLTLTNPLTIIGFIGIYTVMGVTLNDGKMLTIFFLTGGILLGSLIWWLCLSFISSLIGKKINFQSTFLLNKISGFIFLILGLLTVLTTILT